MEVTNLYCHMGWRTCWKMCFLLHPSQWPIVCNMSPKLNKTHWLNGKQLQHDAYYKKWNWIYLVEQKKAVITQKRSSRKRGSNRPSIWNTSIVRNLSVTVSMAITWKVIGFIQVIVMTTQLNRALHRKGQRSKWFHHTSLMPTCTSF